jgi:hypothetical protein
MSSVKQIREREEGKRKHLWSDMQRKWNLFHDELLKEFRYLAGTQECTVEEERSTTVYAYVYEDSRGKKFLSAAVQVADSKFCAMVFLKPPVWNGRDIDESWFGNISGDLRREGAESVWSPGFWEWYTGFEAKGAFMLLSCKKPAEVKELCVDLVRIVGWNFKVYTRHDILSKFSQQ